MKKEEAFDIPVYSVTRPVVPCFPSDTMFHSIPISAYFWWAPINHMNLMHHVSYMNHVNHINQMHYPNKVD